MAQFTELESTTQNYFLLDNGKAVDLYYNTSFWVNYALKQKKALYQTVSGGLSIVCPFEFDEGTGGWYSRGATLNSDDVESVNSAKYDLKHAYGNATIYRIDTLQNSGPEQVVDLVMQRVSGAQKKLRKDIASSVYDGPGGSSDRLTGFQACTDSTTTTKYGGWAEADLQSSDGSYQWKGRTISTSEGISLAVLRTMSTTSKVRDGAGGKIDLVTMNEDLFNIILQELDLHKRYVESSKQVEAGFPGGIRFENMEIAVDDYAPDQSSCGFNTNNFGFGVHAKGNFQRSPWRYIPGSAEDKTMKVYFDGNQICNNRKAQIIHTNLS